MRIQYVNAMTSASARTRRNYGKGPRSKGRADVGIVDRAQEPQGEVTKQMCAILYNHKRIFTIQTVLSA